MRGLMRRRLTRRLLVVAGLGSLADWLVFSALVAVVAARTDGSVFAVAMVTCARLAPSIVIGPLVAPFAGIVGIRRTLVLMEGGRAVAAGVVAAGAAVAGPGGLAALVGGLVLLELAGALSGATRESAISTHVEPAAYPTLNAATGITAYGMLPVGGLLAVLVQLVHPLAPFAVASACYALAGLTHAATPELEAPRRPRRRAVTPLTGLRRVAAPGRLRDVIVVAVTGAAGIVMLFSVGTRLAETVFGSAGSYGLVIAALGAGALAGALTAGRGATARGGAQATGGLLLAAASAPLLLVPGLLPAAGLALIGYGAGVAYVATQAALQRAARAPEEFAAAFALLKAGTAAALVAGPVLLVAGGPALVVTAVAGTSLLAAWRCGRRVDLLPLPAVLLRAVCAPVLRAACRIRVTGSLPTGGAVLASNHPNALDGPLGVLLDRRVLPIAKPQRHPVARLGIAMSGALVTGTGAVDAAVAHLRAGGLVWLAPEGGVNTGPVLARPRTGVARIAAAAGVPVVPVAIHGTAGLRLRDWRPWRRPSVLLVVGAPIPVAADAEPAAAADEVMAALGGLLGQPTTRACPAAAAA
jgi:1-acyl-sn-glycerol-3-phosphate acyltransferase